MEMGKGRVFSGENISPRSKLFGEFDVTLKPLNITVLFFPHDTPVIVLSPLKLYSKFMFKHEFSTAGNIHGNMVSLLLHQRNGTVCPNK